MAKLLSDSTYAVRGRLVGIDASGLVGPFFMFRTPPNTADLNRPGSYIDFRLLDSGNKTVQRRIHILDELDVIIHAATAELSAGTRNEMTFQLSPKSQCQKISHASRCVDGVSPINGKIVDTDERHMVVVDAGVPVVVTLLNHKPSQTKQLKINSWVTFWPAPPTHGVVLGKV